MSLSSTSLPLICPDFTGAASVCGDLGALLIFHDPGACAGGFARLSGRMNYLSGLRALSSELDELAVAFGDSEQVVNRAVEALKTSDKNWAALIGSPVSAMIGSDLDWIAREISDRSGLAVVGVPTTGFDGYDVGIAKAFGVLSEIVSYPSIQARFPMVNILGLNSLDPISDLVLKRIRSFLDGLGLSIGAVWAAKGGFKRLEITPAAVFNLVVSQSGLKLAELLKKKYGQPYSLNLPFGLHSTQKLVDELAAAVWKSLKYFIRPRFKHYSVRGEGRASRWGKTLIVGEPIFSRNLRETLVKDFDLDEVHIFSFVQVHPVLRGQMEEGDEEHMSRLLASEKYKTVIADASCRKLVGNIAKSDFIPCPYPGLGGPDSWAVGGDELSDLNYLIGEAVYGAGPMSLT